jgi:hypothetical protein
MHLTAAELCQSEALCKATQLSLLGCSFNVKTAVVYVCTNSSNDVGYQSEELWVQSMLTAMRSYMQPHDSVAA